MSALLRLIFIKLSLLLTLAWLAGDRTSSTIVESGIKYTIASAIENSYEAIARSSVRGFTQLLKMCFR
ncbi:hypothetical protein H6S82_09020 [Planktothrix sp. FACHB-1355]|uniref:Uncharacterized protein n=1 Tax=Aerosakkonema funiforme FACHB-1375 TaxID=2949571 RepID=A0A926VC98_9CYAN|nr:MULTISPECIES: hypothetical protein [Oscillatoriales]MBD2181187.1 hypothetical protein [Aerosakkonema funiforme FACHB-1375]MBD3558997.1 hypothetical protein [Planktothrix sp. FACHB-1355]